MTVLQLRLALHSQAFTKAKLKYCLMWSLQVSRVVVAAALVVGVITNLALLGLQHNRLPLYSKAGDINLSRKTPVEARKLLAEATAQRQLSVILPDKAMSAPLAEAGLSVDADYVLAQGTNVTGWNRLPLVRAIKAHKQPLTMRYQTKPETLQSYTAALPVPPATPAQNASIVISQDSTQPATISPARAGLVYDREAIVNSIMTAAQEGRLTAIVKPQPISPTVEEHQLADNLALTNRLLQAQLVIKNDLGSYRFTAQDIHSVLKIETDQTGKSTPAIDLPKLKQVLTAATASFYRAPASGRSFYVDGEKLSEQPGVNGHTLDVNASAPLVQAALMNGKAELAVPSVNLIAPQNAERTYTPTSKGLNALIAEFAKTHGGSFQVATQELGGDRAANYRASDATVPASTYKLFLAYAALYKVEQGSLSMSTQVGAGTTQQCIDKMILFSDNTCAVALLNHLTRPEVDAIIHAAGFPRTTLANSNNGYMTTTAGELNSFLIALNGKTLLNDEHTAYLLDLMKRQIYRSGIPSGSPGSVVADKVGFLFGWNHDAAIVYTPKTTYSLVIMTTNSNFATIKSLAAQIHDLYNR